MLVFSIGAIAGVGRHLVGVVDAAGDDGLIGIAFEEIYYDFLADARPKKSTPALACPSLGNPDPTRAFLIILAFAVPMELHFDSAKLVDEDLFAGRTNDRRRLGTVNDRASGLPFR